MEKITPIIEELLDSTEKILFEINILLKQLSPSTQELNDNDLMQIISSSNIRLFVVKTKEEGPIIAMATLVVYKITFKTKGIVEDVVVDKNYRQQGIGKKLLEHIIKEARKQNVQILDLTSNPAREQANRLYLSLGFIKRETNVYRLPIE